MGLTNQDLVKISATLTNKGFEPSEWALFYLVMVDLGVSLEKLKEIKELKSSGQLTDCEALFRLLQKRVDNHGDATTSLDGLIAAMTSNTDKFPGLAKQDYVKCLNQIRKEMVLENDSTLSPMEIVFNSVDLIRAEIYKYLSTYDKACLRLTSKSIWNSTLSNWRKTVELVVGDGNGPISMEKFHEIYLKHERGEGTYELGKLVEYPFTNYELYDETISPFSETWDKSDIHFWTKCAPHITSLRLTECRFFEECFLPTYVWLVTKACRKIEKLKIESCYFDEDYSLYVDDETEEEVKAQDEDDGDNNHEKYNDNKVEKGDEAKHEVKIEKNVDDNDDPFSYHRILKCLEGKPKRYFSEPPKGIANNLKVLHFTNFCGKFETGANLFLDVAPNLKSLSLDIPCLLKGLETCSEREICKLDDFSFLYGNEMDVTALEKYTKTYFNGIKRINVRLNSKDRFISNSGTPIYKIISHSSSALVTLQLTFENYQDHAVYQSWLSELSSFEFPSLKKLQLNFWKDAGMIHFDFATLLKTPNLKSFSIEYEFVEEHFQKLQDTGDWIMEDSLEGIILCLDKLEEFCFDGWMVDKEDLALFRAWFPSLKHLKVGLDEDTSPDGLLAIFKDLKSLTLTTRSKYNQDDFIVAKVLHPEVRMFTECSNLGKLEAVEGEQGHLNVVFKHADLNLIKAAATKVHCKKLKR